MYPKYYELMCHRNKTTASSGTTNSFPMREEHGNYGEQLNINLGEHKGHSSKSLVVPNIVQLGRVCLDPDAECPFCPVLGAGIGAATVQAPGVGDKETPRQKRVT